MQANDDELALPASILLHWLNQGFIGGRQVTLGAIGVKRHVEEHAPATPSGRIPHNFIGVALPAELNQAELA